MKYHSAADELHFYPFVFYETDRKNMYIYCPNCNTEHTVELSKRQNVEWHKNNHYACQCFKFIGRHPQYKKTQYEHKGLESSIDVAEFAKQGTAMVLNAYRHTASFAASNYNSWRPFRRYPDTSTQRTIEFIFRDNGTVEMSTCLYAPMCTKKISVGYRWNNVKKWRYAAFQFEILQDSLAELKGTFLEQYIPAIAEFNDTLSSVANVGTPAGEYTAAFLINIHTRPAIKKLWKAGYKHLVVNKIIEYVTARLNNYNYYGIPCTCSNGIINWQGKTIERILKVEPSKLDNVFRREDITVRELAAAQRLTKLKNVELSKENIDIAGSTSFERLAGVFAENNISVNKMLKYIRRMTKRYKWMLSSTAADYYDYLETLKKLKTPLTSDVVFPTELRTAHDNASETYKSLAAELKDEEFATAVQKYLDWNYSNDLYKIEVIKTATQLKNESTKMHNCAYSYVNRILAGNCAIFIIRQIKKPRTPFYMLELNVKTMEIVQNRGHDKKNGCHNQPLATPAVAAFADEWLKTILKQKSKKSKETAPMARAV